MTEVGGDSFGALARKQSFKEGAGNCIWRMGRGTRGHVSGQN